MVRRLALLLSSILPQVAAAPATRPATRPTSRPATRPVFATVYPAVADPPFQGWGTSLCWWANVAGGYPEPARSRLMDQVFDARAGLGLTVVRYNIGGGENPTDHFLRFHTAVPGYEPEPGHWDWSADAAQRWVLAAAMARGANHLQAFSNSPPHWMTRSGSVTGGLNGAENLRADRFDTFADYLATVVQHFRDAWGVTFDTVDPLNEPAAHWWHHGGWQEGCRFDRPAQDRIVRLLGQQLRDRRLRTTIAASDENSIDDAAESFLALSPPARAFVSQVATHSYGGRNRAAVCELARAAGKDLWMSEYGDVDATGLRMAEKIVADLRGLHPSAWVAWQVADPAGGWGFFRSPLDTRADARWQTNPKYYVMGNFARHIRPGATLVATSDRHAVAAVDARAKTLTVVAVNSEDSPAARTYDLSQFTTLGRRAAAWRTSANERLTSVAPVAVRDGRLAVTLAPKSVTTFVVADTAYTGPPPPLDPLATYRLRTDAGRWLTAAGDARGARVTTSADRPGSWGLLGIGDHRYAIYSRTSGLTLDVAGGDAAPGTPVLQWTDHNADAQRWELVDADGGYAIRCVATGLVLDGSSPDGVVAATDTAAPGQRWHLDR